MTVTTKWALGLAVLLAALLQPPLARQELEPIPGRRNSLETPSGWSSVSFNSPTRPAAKTACPLWSRIRR